ncbi:MAG: saccharopine dehydrogenase NADP-binding domain-containing protein [Polaromonas sp.]|uniref:saccharopine dehydrogenase family protein n=1 Tax=Polaromonas sp. TaxID=1869339 RepID=UPI00326739B3
MSSKQTVVVFGAYGHTGRFIVAELLRQGLTPILVGRDAQKLAALQTQWPGLEMRAAGLDQPQALDAALKGAGAVINAAGPFSLTASPLIEAATRTGTHYLDIVAEPDIAEDIIHRYAEPACLAGMVLAPAIGFYGGLGDLLATAATGDWTQADEVTLAYSLSSWKPTRGTRETISVAEERRGGKRLVWNGERLALTAEPSPQTEWTFPEPIGRQPAVGEFTTADSVMLLQHIKVGRIHQYMTTAPLNDLSDPDESPPAAVDDAGRSAQIFLLEAVVRRGTTQRRAVARGQDIYALTAPLVVQAALRVLSGTSQKRGLVTAGGLGNAGGFLQSLAPEHLQLEGDIGG